MKKHITSILLCAIAPFTFAGEEVYQIDTVHSGISFKIRHNFGKMPGHFKGFEGFIRYNPEAISESYAEAKIAIDSVDTNNAKRDKHLMDEDFFNQPTYSHMTFKSTQWEKVGDNKFKVTGNLTILGTTKSVTLDTELLGKGPGQGHYEGITITGWTASTTIDRRDFGMTYGGPIVGNSVDIQLDIQGHMKEEGE